MAFTLPKSLESSMLSYLDGVVRLLVEKFDLEESDVRACFAGAEGKKVSVEVPKGETWIIKDYEGGPLVVGATFSCKDKLKKLDNSASFKKFTEFGPAWQVKKSTAAEIKAEIGGKAVIKQLRDVLKEAPKAKASKPWAGSSDDETPAADPFDTKPLPTKRIDLRTTKGGDSNGKASPRENGAKKPTAAKKTPVTKKTLLSSSSEGSEDDEKKGAAKKNAGDGKASDGKGAAKENGAKKAPAPDPESSASEGEEPVDFRVAKNAWQNTVHKGTDVVVAELTIDDEEDHYVIGLQDTKAPASSKGLKSVLPLDDKTRAKYTKMGMNVISKSIVTKLEDGEKYKHLVR